MFSALTKLPRTVWFLAAIRFLNDAASDAVYLLLPQNSATAIALFAGYAIFIASTDGAEKALIAELAPKARLGAAFGWLWTRIHPTAASRSAA